ncbi:putative bifunctional diguanylate cyclase/phosphodiesterase [Actinopolyspora saharensis]|uniref:PAS domain S-box-containing protein/diguanylate cyclase (GGDEF) domain-containing protein n=1 Tax=Actinopolyspora saharensis TaxID=995062 RepID=A0A1H1FNV3_9ACTN|nr:bifunctional diguanylate cyclase/phosphodiesterase [Actinopolyspora saharensis]SDR02399.1 PAS domain S-box-containing protein/diguanylate cyclase (GGDEF) domain-containing protein [Actinopolyspora saharensis]
MEQQESGTFDESAENPTAQTDPVKVLAAEDMREYAIFSLDTTGHVASWNASAARLKGYSSEEVIGRHFSLFYLEGAAASGYPRWELEQATAHGFFIDRGWRVRKDGSRFWAHVVITAQRSPAGKLDGFIKITRDESEVGARQQRSMRRFTDLFELAPVGIALFDQAGHLLDANGALGELLGYQLQDFFTMAEHDFLHPSDEGGGLFPSPNSPGGRNVGEPVPHRVLARSDGEPVLCQLRSTASVRDDGSRSWLLAFHDVTAQVRHTEALRYQATHDATTGLLNRRGSEELLSDLLSHSIAEKVAVLFCDLNNFKRVNDSLGHAAGDELLAAVAERLTTELPPKCTPARFYGDEFVVFCSDIDVFGSLEEFTRRVSELFRMDVRLHERMVHVSASVGSTVIGSPETNLTELMQSAEAAMFQDRVRGQGQTNIALGRVLPSRAGIDQLAMEEQLREALSNDRLGVHYQPVLANDGSVVLAEALLRWSHPEHGPLSPDVVLTVAEHGGLLAELDRSVLRTALRESVGWRCPDGRPVGVAVNLAGLRPGQPGFTEEVSAAISEAGTSPENLVLEMVETVIAELEEQPLQAMRELTETGVRFAMDDFGSGYSSLARLKDLPTQIIKLDRKFVSGLGTEITDLGIARAVAELARTMGLTCIAEGVENATQHHLLRTIGIDAYQGYLFSAPLPADRFREYLATTPAPSPGL